MAYLPWGIVTARHTRGLALRIKAVLEGLDAARAVFSIVVRDRIAVPEAFGRLTFTARGRKTGNPPAIWRGPRACPFSIRMDNGEIHTYEMDGSMRIDFPEEVELNCNRW